MHIQGHLFSLPSQLPNKTKPSAYFLPVLLQKPPKCSPDFQNGPSIVSFPHSTQNNLKKKNLITFPPAHNPPSPKNKIQISLHGFKVPQDPASPVTSLIITFPLAHRTRTPQPKGVCTCFSPPAIQMARKGLY